MKSDTVWFLNTIKFLLLPSKPFSNFAILPVIKSVTSRESLLNINESRVLCMMNSFVVPLTLIQLIASNWRRRDDFDFSQLTTRNNKKIFDWIYSIADREFIFNSKDQTVNFSSWWLFFFFMNFNFTFTTEKRAWLKSFSEKFREAKEIFSQI